MNKITPEQIDALLPQTQCGLCGYGGCMPYAEAIVFEHAPINLCPPGGVKTLHELGNLLHQDTTAYAEDMAQKAKPKLLAIIRETECIGCTKCIQACPVDAILGSAKQMHSVIADECTGCELCIAPCPVDCIDLIAHPQPEVDSEKARTRFNSRQQRLRQEKKVKAASTFSKSQEAKKSYISDALARAKAKRA